MLGVIFAAVLTAAAADWRTPDPETLLVIDTTKGRIIVEMRPEFAPKSVERVKQLAREGVYDGLQFHRVIDGFVAQTGNPNNKDGGVSAHPDLPAEFQFRLPVGEATLVTTASDRVSGFVGSAPIEGVPPQPGQPLRAWGAYCTGVVGMGRQAAPDSGNSEIFFMRAPSRRLDRDYSVWGRVVVGQEVVAALNVGEPPAGPDLMRRVRVAADLPTAERPALKLADPAGPAFQAQIARLRAAKGADFTVCDAAIPVQGG